MAVPHKPKPFFFLLCYQGHYPAKRGHSQQGILFPWKGQYVFCNNAWAGHLCQSIVYMGGRSHGVPGEHYLPSIVQPGFMCSAGKWPAHTWPFMQCKRKRGSLERVTFFRSSVVRFWRPYVHGQKLAGAVRVVQPSQHSNLTPFDREHSLFLPPRASLYSFRNTLLTHYVNSGIL